ncbi:hypothetical protein M885DRAFT_537454, partial [Pelagophyceae sp. CCMP2097]
MAFCNTFAAATGRDSLMSRRVPAPRSPGVAPCRLRTAASKSTPVVVGKRLRLVHGVLRATVKRSLTSSGATEMNIVAELMQRCVAIAPVISFARWPSPQGTFEVERRQMAVASSPVRSAFARSNDSRKPGSLIISVNFSNRAGSHLTEAATPKLTAIRCVRLAKWKTNGMHCANRLSPYVSKWRRRLALGIFFLSMPRPRGNRSGNVPRRPMPNCA